MNNKIMLFLSVLAALSCLFKVQAASVEVNWIKPEKYTDIKAGQGHRKHFRDRTLTMFTEHFQKLAQQLPEQQKLIINVTNVDLAGDVNFHIDRIRIIKDLYIPRISLNYQLLTADNRVIKEESVKIKDMAFMNHVSVRNHSKPLSYEKAMLDKWFKKTF